MSDAVRIRLDEITLDPKLRVRDIKPATVRDYAARLESSEPPPIELGRINSVIKMVDGWHRYEAAKLAKRLDIEAVVEDMTEDEAYSRAVDANMKHGEPLTLAERKAAAQELMRRGWVKKGAEERGLAALARKVGLNRKTTMRLWKALGVQNGHQAAKPATTATAPSPTSATTKREPRRPGTKKEQRKRFLLAVRLATDNPSISLKEIEQRAGISEGTAVKARQQARQQEQQLKITPSSAVPMPGPAQSKLVDALPQNGKQKKSVIPDVSPDPIVNEDRHIVEKLYVHLRDFVVAVERRGMSVVEHWRQTIGLTNPSGDREKELLELLQYAVRIFEGRVIKQ